MKKVLLMLKVLSGCPVTFRELNKEYLEYLKRTDISKILFK